MGALLAVIVLVAPVVPVFAACAAYRDDRKLGALAEELGERGVPFGGTGKEIVAAAARFARMAPARNHDRAATCGALSAQLALVRFEMALGLWIAGGLTLTAAVLYGFAQRSLASVQALSWSSPLAAWAAKRGLILSIWILVAGPLLFVMAPLKSAMALLVVMLAVASVAAHVFVRNLPARL